jgi:hypothetical protein
MRLETNENKCEHFSRYDINIENQALNPWRSLKIYLDSSSLSPLEIATKPYQTGFTPLKIHSSK